MRATPATSITVMLAYKATQTSWPRKLTISVTISSVIIYVADELDGDKDSTFILAGIKEGFHIIDPQAELTEVCVPNHTSAVKPEAKSHFSCQT